MAKRSDGSRRTQAERTAATVTKLLEATIDSIVELGYAGATTRVICERAGVSQGGLFRHFATRRDLIVAAIEHLHETRRSNLNKDFDPDLGGFSPPRIIAQLRAVRDHIREPRNMAYLEVMLAARTEPDLRAGLGPLLAGQDRAVRASASKNPLFAALSEESQRVWLDLVTQTLWVESLWRTALPEPSLDDRKLELLVRLAFLLAEREGVALPA